MLLNNKKVAIIGGGPGGLMLAKLLQLKGASVKVYERDINEKARVQGATLDLHYHSGLKAVAAVGLMEVFKATYRPGADKGRVVDEHAHIIFDEHDRPSNEDLDSESARPEIDRGPLRDMLLAVLQPGTIAWGSHFQKMSKTDEGWKLEFKNGTTATADIVIGADGGNSRIRPYVTPVRASYAGVIILQGNVDDAATAVPELHELLKGGKLYVHSGGKFIHVSSKGDGSLDFYISSKREENGLQKTGVDFSDREQVCAWFKETFPGWDAIWLSMFEKTSLPLLLRPQYCIPFDQSWEAQPDITLLGDAAHIMPPSGEGVNLAMLDALELSECLTGNDFNDMRSAIAAYEKSMQERGTEEARESIKMTDWMHADDAMEKMIQMFNQN